MGKRKLKINIYILICILCVAIGILMPIIGSILIKNYKLETNEISCPIAPGDYEDYTIESQRMILKTGIENFDELDLDNKKLVLETLAKVELNRLGCNNVIIEFKSLKDETIAEINCDKRIISINLKFLLDRNIGSEILCQAVVHEVRHQYQADSVECYINASPEERRLLIFEGCETWREAECTYIAPKKLESDYEEQVELYKDNALEQDANTYAYERYLEYCKALSIMY